MSGKPCQLGCSCDRHDAERKRKSVAHILYPRQDKLDEKDRHFYERPGSQCIIVENGERCKRGVRNVKRGYCSKHFARLQRTGDPLRENVKPKLSPEEMEIAAKLKAKKEAIRLAEYQKSMIQRQQMKDKMCICGQSIVEHKSYGKYCMHFMCKCKKFEETNAEELRAKQKRLADLGFVEHVNNQAKCAACLQVIKIGSWLDPLIMRRAAMHFSRECAVRKKVCMVD